MAHAVIAVDHENIWEKFIDIVPNIDAVITQLNSTGVSTDIYYPFPIRAQPVYTQCVEHGTSITAWQANHVISLPMYPHLEAIAQYCIIDTIKIPWTTLDEKEMDVPGQRRLELSCAPLFNRQISNKYRNDTDYCHTPHIPYSESSAASKFTGSLA